MKSNAVYATWRSQRGFAVLVFVVALILAGGLAILWGIAESSRQRQYDDPITAQNAAAARDTLDSVKAALFQYILSPPDLTYWPGVLPTPDSLAYKNVVGDGTYDGNEDNKGLGNTGDGLSGISASRSTLKRCLVRIPWQALKLSFGNISVDDPGGAIPWLAVSANLVYYDDCLKIFNSDVAALPSPTAVATPNCPSVAGPPYQQPTTLPHPWLTVRDGKGQILSNKVAAVLILPGPAIRTETRTQNRSVAAPGNPGDYLDSIRLPLGCTTSCTAFDNASLSNDFVQIPLGTHYPIDSEDASKRSQLVPFNDVVVFITVDELMHYVEQRVLRQMSTSLQKFKSDTTTKFFSYPWMAPLTSALADETSVYSQAGTILGAFPFMTEYSAGAILPYYRTGFGWSLTGATESLGSACYQISATPNYWIRNPLEGTLNGSTSFGGPFNASAGVPASSGTCKWLGGTQASCEYDAGTISRQFNLFSTQTRCNNGAPISTTSNLKIKRKLIFLASGCSTPDTYQPATASTTHQWSWKCSNFNQPAVITIQDTISDNSATYNRLPKTAELTSAGVVQNFSLTGMTYNPQMPAWFYERRWHLSAFAARAPSLTPQPTVDPCSGAASLTVAGAGGREAVVLLAGRPADTQTRPSNNLNDYLDGKNQTAFSTCEFERPPLVGQSTAQDPLMVVIP